jgi:cell division transport system permease protein
MKALLVYSVTEALSSLRRSWRTNVLSIGTIAAAVFAAAAVLLVSLNVQRIVARLSTTAELTIYLRQGVSPADRQRVADEIAASPLVASSTFVDAATALERFRREMPELAALVGTLEHNPLPPAFEVRLRDGRSEAEVRALAEGLSKSGLVEDVRYDRQVLDRLIEGLTTARGAGIFIAVVLVFAAIVTITSVLRLAYLSRREEMDILFLIGVPPSAIRGPFVVEGVLQTLIAALAAIGLLLVAFGLANAQYGVAIAQAFGIGSLTFLPVGWSIAVCLASVAVGALAGLGAAWKQS